MKLDPTKCSERVLHYQGRWYCGGKQCSRKWTVTREGKHYCSQHNPEKVTERKAKQQLEYEKQRARSCFGWVGNEFYDALKTLIVEGGDVSIKKAKALLRHYRKERKLLLK